MGPVSDTGLSVIYEPLTGLPVVDIVIIHGLKGHPYKIWTSKKDPGQHPAAPRLSQTETSVAEKEGKMKFWHRPLPWKSSTKSSRQEKSPQRTHINSDSRAQSSHPAKSALFWPADLLLQQCPQARVLTYGYDTKITKYMAGGANKNSILSHSKDFLFALGRERVEDRPLIFVCHSLGGIVAKEMLAGSSVSTEPMYKGIVQCTAAVIFLGTPHRGSPELSAVGEAARSVLSILGMETTSTMLDSLGLKTTDLERAQESFSRIWQEYDFRVKTFQEGLSLTGVNLGVLGSKVVPDSSSLIGDEREHAETLQANHLDICRFSGLDDPNYLKLAGEIQLIYRSILHLNTPLVPQNEISTPVQPSLSPVHQPFNMQEPEDTSGFDLAIYEKSCLESFQFPRMNSRFQSIECPMKDTCIWLFQNEEYERWSSGADDGNNLIWLKGKPGSGKSVLMKEAFRQTALKQRGLGFSTAAFFFNAKGEKLEHSFIGLLRSMLYQLLPQYRQHLPEFRDQWGQKDGVGCLPHLDPPWEEPVLISLLTTIFSHRPVKEAKIFIDAVDECDSKDHWRLVFFWREMVRKASTSGGGLSVCMSSRISTTYRCFTSIIVDDRNGHDIEKYVDQRFEYTLAGTAGANSLRREVLNRSGGVFLWVVLVVDDLIKQWEEGKGSQYLLRRLGVVPQELEIMFAEMITKLDSATKPLTLRLFQWAVLATVPLRLHEWHHILAFIKEPPPSSLEAWGNSVEVTDSDDQLERQIKSLSKGLLQVSRMSATNEPQDIAFEAASVSARAGSLDLENGETRVIEVIHESVREFFFAGRGFSILGPLVEPNAVGKGHLSIMKTCLDYLHINELDTLIAARNLRAQLASSQTDTAQSQNTSSVSHILAQHDTVESQNPNELTQVSSVQRDTGLQLELSPPPLIWAQEHKLDECFAFHYLSEIFSQDNAVDVDFWIRTTQHAHSQGFSGFRLRESTNCPSITGQSQVLQGHPALLQYATFQLFTHARLAKAMGADIRPIMDRLEEPNTWMRWVALREDIPFSIGFTDYVAMYEGSDLLDSPDDAGDDTDENFSEQDNMLDSDMKRSRPASGGSSEQMELSRRNLFPAWSSSDQHWYNTSENLFKDPPPFTYRLRRSGSASVSSFSSAASSQSEVMINL